MIQNNSYFKLFGNCITVKGASRSIVCDLQRSRYRFIPNLLYEILFDQKNKTIHETKAAYQNQYDQGIDAFFDLMIKEEWGFLTNNPECFPELSLEWDSPLTITNSIVDINEKSTHDFEKIISQLSDLGCEALQIRAYCKISSNELDKILAPAHESRLKSIELVLKYEEYITGDYLKELITRHKRIRSVIIHSGPVDDQLKEFENCLTMVVFTKQVIDSNAHCGFISAEYFAINIPLFTESQKRNSCLNRKISIDETGEIKNCPSMTQSYGNIKTKTLKEALDYPDFKKMWGINKDQISICKDCEFRYICTDCRVFLKNKDDIYSKPAKCSYDPYTATWQKQTDNPNVKFKKWIE